MTRITVCQNAGVIIFRQPAQAFEANDPAAPREQADVSTPARRTAVAIENRIRRDFKETGAFIREDGAVILQRQGLVDRVSFSDAELAVMAATTFVHNHPGGAGPSIEDVAVASEYRLAELRVVTAYCRFTISDLTKRSRDYWQAAFDGAKRKVIPHVEDRVKTGAVHLKNFGREVEHTTWRLVAQQHKFNYRRQRS